MSALKCGCGASPCPSELPGTGYYEEKCVGKFICHPCWCVENYGLGSTEALEAKAGRTMTTEAVGDALAGIDKAMGERP